MAILLLTGATGFVGAHLVALLQAQGWLLRAVLRSGGASVPEGVEPVVAGDLAEAPDLRWALAGVETVIHLAGRAHAMRETADDPQAQYHLVNAQATRHLAEQAAAAGVRRLVFLSSIKVNGESTVGRPFVETDRPAPQDAYARSKQAAEAALWEVAAATGLEAVVIRPPLVYGPRVKANFLRLLGLIDRGIPLPFGAVDNRRSLVGVWNLCDLIAGCIRHPAAAGETFLVSDGRDCSTADLVRILARGMDRPARLPSVPPILLRAAGRLGGRADAIERLIGSLQVDPSKAMRRLGWRPPVALEDGLAQTARWYRDAGSP